MVMAAAATMTVVGLIFTASLITLPRWCVRSLHRHRLWRLRDQVVDSVLAGCLPANHPAVKYLISELERAIRHCHRMSLLKLRGFILLRRRLSRAAETQLRSRSAPPSLAGLGEAEKMLLKEYRQAEATLLAGNLLLGSWLGVYLVLRRLPAAATRSAGARQAMTMAADEVTTKTRIGRAARDAVSGRQLVDACV